MAADSNINANNDLPTFSISIDGSPMDGTYQVKSVEVYKEVNRINSATIIINDGQASVSDFKISEKNDFKPGNEIEIKAGYHSKEETIFKGIVIKHGLKIKEGVAPVLEIECRDKAVKMTVGRKNAYYLNSTDSDIITKIVGQYGLSKDIDTTDFTHKELVQYYSTDWDFVLSRADVNGMLVVADDGKLSIKTPLVSDSPVLELDYGVSIIEFQAEMDARTSIPSVKSVSWNIKNQAMVDASISSISVNDQGNIKASDLADVVGAKDFLLQSSTPLDKQLITQWSKARLQKSWMSKIKGSVKFQGNASVKHGKIIKLGGVGDRFNGNAFVRSVYHHISTKNWTTEAYFGLSDQWFSEKRDVNYPEASGLLPAVQGLQIGIVKQIEEDENGEFRVNVTIPVMQSDSNGIWARMSHFYATNEAGSYFMPEVKDEVVLGFVNNDPCYPVILGMLYSGTHKSPYTPEKENSIKAIVTKSKMILSFNDKDKIIQIETPGKNIITMTDKDGKIQITDQNKNMIEMSSGGIKMESKSDINITADGKINITAKGNLSMSANEISESAKTNLTLDAKSNLSMSGLNISGSAKANVDLEAKANVAISGLNISETAKVGYTAKGNAMAELSAAGQVTVKGAIVMIN